MKRLPASSRRIEQLAEYSFRELTLRVEDDTSPVLPALTRYYLPATKVHVAVRMRDLDFETISRKSPMLIQSFGCESAGHDETLTIRASAASCSLLRASRSAGHICSTARCCSSTRRI